MPLVPLSSRKTVAAHVVEQLKAELAAGHWAGRLPGERQLCVQLGVSRPTLRKALKELRSKGLLAVAQGRPTTPTRRALRRRAAPDATVVLALTPEPLEQLPASVVYTFDQLRGNLAARSLRLDVHTLRLPRGGRPEPILEALHAAERPAACIIYQAEKLVHRWFFERGLPCVVFGTQDAIYPLSAVDTDQRATCRHAAQAMLRAGIAAGGIGLVTPQAELSGHAFMRLGFADVLGRSARVLEVPLETAKLCSALDGLRREARGRMGLIFARASHAVAALGHLAIRRGLAVPGEVAIISLADDPFLRHIQPVLARYHRDEVALARKLSTMVLRAATTAGLTPRMTMLMPEFVRGETV